MIAYFGSIMINLCFFKEFFIWVGMGAANIPPNLEPTLKEICSQLVPQWLTPESKSGDASLQWKTLAFTVQKVAN